MCEIDIFLGQNELDFVNRFSDKSSCYSYLSFYKWKDGFECPYCKSKEEYKFSKPHHKRCKSCKRLVSATNGTLFHKVKFDIVKAFYIVFKMSATTKSISAEQLSKSIGVNRKTALLFQQKVRLAMKSSENHPLSGEVEVDEAFIGQTEEGKTGRGAENKAQIVVVIEKNGASGIKRVYAKRINDASSAELQSIFDKHISPQAKVVTDKWRGYTPLKENYNITQEKSMPKTNFKVMHRCIQQLKSWLRGIHHSVDQSYLQGYLDEFCYRINRSIHKNSIFDNLLQRMVSANHVPKNKIKFAHDI